MLGRLVRGLVWWVPALLLVACGGGGGGPSDGSWHGPIPAENDETGGATNVRLAVGAGGHAVVSWSVFHGASLTDEFVNHYDPATGWQGFYAPHRDIGSTTYPSMQLAIDAAGNALGIWGERQSALPGQPSTFYATTYDAGTGTWSGAVPMENDDTGTADQAAVAAGPGGSFWVLFGLNMGTTVGIYVNHFTPVGGWSGPVALDTAAWDPADTFLSKLDIAADAAGNAVAAWSRYTDTDGSGTIEVSNDNESVFARRYDGNTMTWAPAQTLNTTDINGAYVSDVQADPTGGFLVLWFQYDALFDARGWGQFYRGGVLQPATPLWDHVDDYFPRGAGFDAGGNAFVLASAGNAIAAVRYVAGAGWQAPEPLHGAGTDAALEDFAVSPGGDAFVLWRQDDVGTYDDVLVRRFDHTGGFWDGAVNVDTPDSGEALTGARIVADAAGNAMASWHATSPAGQSYFAVRFFAPAGWGAATEIDAGPLDTVSFGTCLGVDGAGAVLAAWAQGASGDQDVYSNRFD